jgi:hypothetical protein
MQSQVRWCAPVRVSLNTRIVSRPDWATRAPIFILAARSITGLSNIPGVVIARKLLSSNSLLHSFACVISH